MAGRTAIMPILAAGAALLAAVPSTAPPSTVPQVSLAATALYMGGTFDQLSIPPDTTDFISSYVGDMSRVYVHPSGLCTGGSAGCTPLALYTPEEFRLITGVNDLTFDDSVAAGMVNLDACLRGLPCVVTAAPYTSTATRKLTDSAYTVQGYSQSATVATVEKRALIANPPAVQTSFVLVANPNRPNGGILERFAGLFIPLIGVSFNGATPTDSAPTAPLTTVDVVRQYDLMSDFPANPLNLLADLNAVLGYYFVHLQPFDISTAELQGQYQDSTYYLVPTTTLPLLTPIAQIPWVGSFISALLDPPMRVLVESAYNRTINAGAPTSAQWFYIGNPIATAINSLKAMPVGWDNAIAYVTGDSTNRPFKTQPEPTYGVGGPPVNAGAIDPYGAPTPYQPPADTVLTAAGQPSAPSVVETVRPAATGTAESERPTSAHPECAPATPSPVARTVAVPTAPRTRRPLADSANSTSTPTRGHRDAHTDVSEPAQHRSGQKSS